MCWNSATPPVRYPRVAASSRASARAGNGCGHSSPGTGSPRTPPSQTWPGPRSPPRSLRRRGGTPALMRDGQVWLNPAANGMAHVSCVLPAPVTGCPPSGALTSRHPRTLAGISPEGHLMLVTVDGRNPGTSVGATLPEAAQVMQWLGARDAVGLGSGGDTTLMVGNTLYNRPWDHWGIPRRASAR
ncbi:phosphodiester glycosidase family protein [Streptomyces sp. SBR177]